MHRKLIRWIACLLKIKIGWIISEIPDPKFKIIESLRHVGVVWEDHLVLLLLVLPILSLLSLCGKIDLLTDIVELRFKFILDSVKQFLIELAHFCNRALPTITLIFIIFILVHSHGEKKVFILFDIFEVSSVVA